MSITPAAAARTPTVLVTGAAAFCANFGDEAAVRQLLPTVMTHYMGHLGT